MKIRWMLDSAVMLLLCAGCSSNGTVGTLADLLPRYLAAAGSVCAVAGLSGTWPGEGLARYPMI